MVPPCSKINYYHLFKTLFTSINLTLCNMTKSIISNLTYVLPPQFLIDNQILMPA